MADGIVVRLAHTGSTTASVLIADVSTVIDGGNPKPGPVYVPVGGASVDLVYTGDVAKSFEFGNIRTFTDNGFIISELIVPIGAVTSILIRVTDGNTTSQATTDGFVLMEADTALTTYTLMDAADAPQQGVQVKHIGNVGITARVTTTGGQLIDGIAATFDWAVPLDAYHFVPDADAGAWWVF